MTIATPNQAAVLGANQAREPRVITMQERIRAALDTIDRAVSDLESIVGVDGQAPVEVAADDPAFNIVDLLECYAEVVEANTVAITQRINAVNERLR